MKRVFIIHGWGGTPTAGWFSWLRKELEGRGFEVHVPQMPEPDKPEINAWAATLEELVKEPDKNTFFIGHSVGCQTILRYLGKLPENTKTGGAICVAGWFVLKDLESEEDWDTIRPWLIPASIWNAARPIFKDDLKRVKSWLDQCLQCENIKIHADDLTAIFSDNDPYVPLDVNKNIFETLGAKIIVMPGITHLSEDDFDELPVVLEELLKMTRS